MIEEKPEQQPLKKKLNAKKSIKIAWRIYNWN